MVKQLIKPLLLALLLAAIITNKQRQSIHVISTDTNDGLFEDGNKAAVKIYKSLASTTIKRRQCVDILLLLPFASFYWIRDIEVFMKKTINVTFDYAKIFIFKDIARIL